MKTAACACKRACESSKAALARPSFARHTLQLSEFEKMLSEGFNQAGSPISQSDHLAMTGPEEQSKTRSHHWSRQHLFVICILQVVSVRSWDGSSSRGRDPTEKKDSIQSQVFPVLFLLP